MTHKRKYILHALVIIASAVIVVSCKIGHHYTRPDVELPVSLTEEESADSASFADRSWTEIYTDSILQNLINKALTYNKDMLMAAARIKELAAMKRIDYAKMFPSLDLRVYGENEQDNYGGDNPSDDNQFDLKANIAWEVDLWGKLRWNHEASTAEFMASIENRRALQMSLIAQVAQAYYELVALDNELSIVRQTVTARRESEHLARIRYEGGLTSEVTYRQAQVELSKTATLLPDLERQITSKENEIAFLTGEYPHHIARSTLPQEVSLPDSLPVGLPSSLLERRPDVREAEQKLIAANASVGAAYTSMFPNITLTASLGAESEELKDLLSSPYHLISVNLLQPVFAMGKNRARHKAAKAAYERAVYAYEKTVLSAFRDAFDAIANFNKIKEIYQTRYHLESSSKTALSLALVQYVNGAIGYMDLLDAQRTYLDAQISLSNALLDSQLATVNLYKALGGGWERSGSGTSKNTESGQDNGK